MPLRFVLDEHLRGLLWKAIQHHNAASAFPIDVVRVGDPADLPLGSTDPDILLWAEREGRILISQDRDTMITFFWNHLHAGHRSPGLLLLRSGVSLPIIVFELALISHASDPADLFGLIRYIP
jgi:hypothetical protein